MKRIFLLLFIVLSLRMVHSQSTNDVLNLLISNGTITQEQADSVRAEAAIKQQDADANKKTFLVNAARQIQISGYTQIRYQILDEKGKYDGFDIRRARLDIKGTISPYFGYRLQTEFAASPKIMDAYAEVKLSDYFNFTIGQFKIPLGYENLASVNKFELIDFSQITEALVARSKDASGNSNGRDIGIQLNGSFSNKDNQPVVEYRIAVLNGSGINVADTSNEAKDIAGRIQVNPVKGLSFAGAYYTGWEKAIKHDSAGRSQDRERLGFELNYQNKNLLLRGEYMKGKDGKTTREGWYAMAGYYLIPQKLQVIAKYDTYDPSTSKADDISTNYVVGANYNFTNWSRLQAFYTFRKEQGASKNNNYFSVQFQIGF